MFDHGQEFVDQALIIFDGRGVDDKQLVKKAAFDDSIAVAILLLNDILLVAGTKKNNNALLCILQNDFFAWAVSTFSEIKEHELEHLFFMCLHSKYGAEVWSMLHDRYVVQWPVMEHIIREDLWNLPFDMLRQNGYDKRIGRKSEQLPGRDFDSYDLSLEPLTANWRQYFKGNLTPKATEYFNALDSENSKEAVEKPLP